jgi:hypothetical protein
MKRVLLGFVLCLFSASAWSAADETKAGTAFIEHGSGSVTAEEKKAYSGTDYITLRVPFFSDRFSDLPVAVVNGETISLDDLKKAVGARHEGVSEGKTSTGTGFSHMLGLLIDVKLITQEGRNIGLDELPDVKAAMDKFSKSTMREMLQKRQIADITADEAEIEKIYREAVMEYRMKLVMFDDETAATQMKSVIKAGASFEELGEKAVAENRVKMQEEGGIRAKELAPEIAKVVSTMKAGEVSDVVKISDEKKNIRFVLVKLEEIRFPDDPKTREEARNTALSRKQWAALFEYNKALAKKYVKLDRKIFDSIDYGSAKKSFDSWLKDKRVIATIKGDKPLTVGELSEEVRRKYFHGIDDNTVKRITKERLIEVYESVVARKILLLEAARQGIDKSREYRDKVTEYEDSLIFGLFIRDIVEPDSKLKGDEVKAYYDDQIKDYTYPEMVQISSLVFDRKADAEYALEKLQKGDDFLWVKENAQGQVTGTWEDPLKFERATLFITDLPEDLQKLVAGAKAGTYGIFPADGQYYVVFIRDIIPSRNQPFDEVKETIAKKLYNEKIRKVTADWTAKLSASSDVKIYLPDFE